jgi:hypothetical protein
VVNGRMKNLEKIQAVLQEFCKRQNSTSHRMSQPRMRSTQPSSTRFWRTIARLLLAQPTGNLVFLLPRLCWAR